MLAETRLYKKDIANSHRLLYRYPMCGICGFVSSQPFVTLEGAREALARMNRAILHRGPDDEGYFLTSTAALAMRRLAIIDIAHGHQPMTTDDGQVTIVFNGEIYNFPELRAQLAQQGVVFKTHSDTEVVLELYARKGLDFVNDLSGMFAIAIWDARSRELLLVRDRFGKKPLYYSLVGDTLVFGSELKALLQHPAISPVLDPDGLMLFMTYDYVPYPYSIMKGVKKLPPGTLLRFKDGRISQFQYWNLRFSPFPADIPHDEASLAALLLDRLTHAVDRRLVSEVPLGVFLSGGLDSSLITALMCKLRPPRDVKTFSIHFDEKSFDESDYSTRVAAYLGTDHHTRLFHSQELVDLVPALAGALDEPFADASIFPTYLLSRFTRKHVTVALCGDGSDELLAGYPTFQAAKIAALYRRMPAPLRHAGEWLVRRLPTSTANMSLDFKLKQFVSAMDIDDDSRRQQAWLSGVMPLQLSTLFSPDFLRQCTLSDPYSLVDAAMADCNATSPIDRATYFYSKFYLAEDILTKSDRASMANSLEVRAPFLDKDVAEFIAMLPGALKLKGFKTKYLLKKAARGLLPDDIIDRPKKGFGVPVGKWFRGELREFLGDHLSRDSLRESGIFQSATIDQWLKAHWAGTHDHRKQLFPLLMFALWKEAYLKA